MRSLKGFGILLLIFLWYTANSQNLVPNHDFEGFEQLPSNVAQWNGCTGWSNLNGGFVLPYATPDYLHLLGNGYVNLPNSIFATVEPLSGNAIIGLITFSETESNFREYISCELTSPLVVGQSYSASFWVTNGSSNHHNGYSTDHLGLYFSTTAPIQIDHEPINVTPQAEVDEDLWSTSWQQFSFSFTADSAYTQLTIGNFFSDSLTNLTFQVNGSNTTAAAYYFIDKVEVTPTATELTVTGDSLICEGESAVLTANSDSLRWINYSEPETLLSTSPELIITPDSTTTYLAITPTDTASFVVVVLPLPEVNLGNDTTLCMGKTLTLDATTQGAAYLWQNGLETSSIIVSATGTYWVEVNLNGCILLDTIHVDIVTVAPTNLEDHLEFCVGDSVVLNPQPTYDTYLWSTGSEAPHIVIKEAGHYSLEVSQNGCIMTDAVSVSTKDVPILSTLKDITLCERDTWNIQLEQEGDVSYVWENETTSPNRTITQPGNYSVEATNECGSRVESFQVFNNNCVCSLYIPNAITANGDQLNDVLDIIYSCEFRKYNLQIFNRWGQIVFESVDPKETWNGGFINNYYVPGGLYTFRLIYEWDLQESKTLLESGTITVIR